MIDIFFNFLSQISTSVWTLICVQTVQLVSTLKAPTNVDVLQDSRDLSVARVGNRFKNKKSDKNYDVLFITSGYFFYISFDLPFHSSCYRYGSYPVFSGKTNLSL